MKNGGLLLEIVMLTKDGRPLSEFLEGSCEVGSVNLPVLRLCYIKERQLTPILDIALNRVGGTRELTASVTRSDTTVSLAGIRSEDKETGPGLERPSR